MSKFKQYLEATSTIKKPKLYKIESERSRMGGGTSYSYYVGTLEELIKTFSYTLEKGASWQYKKGNKKINRNPKNIKSLISNIYNADNNSTANGYSGNSYSEVPLTYKDIKEYEENGRMGHFTK